MRFPGAFLIFLVIAASSCSRLPATLRHKTVFVNPDIPLLLIDSLGSDFHKINMQLPVARFHFLFKKELKKMGMQLADSAAGAEYHIAFDPLLLSVVKSHITISDSVKGKLLSGHFTIYAANMHLSYLMKKGDTLWYSHHHQQQVQELYKSRTIQNNALLYAVFTDRDKWEQDGRFQLQHLGFHQMSIDQAFSALAPKMAADFKKASRKMPANISSGE